MSALILLYFAVLLPSVTPEYFSYTLEQDPDLGSTYSHLIDNQVEYVFNLNASTDISITTSINNGSSIKSPIIFEVKREYSYTTWALPTRKDGEIYSNSRKRVCGGAKLRITVSTTSKRFVGFSISFNAEDRIVTGFRNSYTSNLTGAAPAEYRVVLPKSIGFGSRYSLLLVRSLDGHCASVGVSTTSCSSGLEDDSDGATLPVRNTFTSKAAINLKREDLTRGTLLLTFKLENAEACSSETDTTLFKLPSRSMRHSKDIEFAILEKIGDDAYMYATLSTFFYLLIFCIGFCFLFWTRFQNYSEATYPQDCIESPSQDEKMDRELLCCMFFLVPTIATDTRPNTPENTCKNCSKSTKSTKRYVTTLCVVAAFYILPVFQFVMLYQKVINETGNEDLCYYNYMCLHPLGSLTTFNHMFSNIGYVMLGALFILLVSVEQKRKVRNHELGLNSHYGIFYAMGVSLAMEGIMSAFYHICPNRLNYQFDMCFMYVTTLLCLVKLYQGRHPDSNASALMAYGSLAIVVLLVAAGVLFQNWYFWCAITLTHFGVVLIMSLHLYSLGDWRLGWPEADVISSIFHPFRSGTKWLSFFLVLMNVANWTAAGLGYLLFFKIHDIASHLVFVLLINLLLYSLVYLFLKIRFREKVLWPTWLYVALSIPFWFIGLYLFIFRRVDGWHLTQAQSRNLNEDCVLWQFYDWHDIWHFLSAFGIFFMFMFFFTIDDDLRNVKRSSIKVF